MLKGTEDTPGVILDAGKGVFEISGRSLPEDVLSFFNPVLTWLDSYFKSPLPKTEFSFKLSYFNTASSKLILDILMRLEDCKNAGNNVTVRWHYPEDDEDMKDAGVEYSEIVALDFEHLPYKE